MIKQILFDCGGVLVEMKFRDLMLEISGSKEIADYFMCRIWAKGSPWLLFDKGEISSDEILPRLKEFMPEEYHLHLEKFVERWLDALPPMPLMETIVDDLKKKGYKCYLLSNFSERFEEMYKRVPVLNKLDGGIVSYKAHLIKPSREIYLYTLDALGIRAEETLFIDDVEKNAIAAEELNIKTHLFKSPEQLRKTLEELGIL